MVLIGVARFSEAASNSGGPAGSSCIVVNAGAKSPRHAASDRAVADMTAANGSAVGMTDFQNLLLNSLIQISTGLREQLGKCSGPRSGAASDQPSYMSEKSPSRGVVLRTQDASSPAFDILKIYPRCISANNACSLPVQRPSILRRCTP